MSVTYIERVGAYLPKTMSVGELSGPLGLSSAQQRVFTRFLGLERIPVAEDMELADMLWAAGENVLDGVDRDSVRYIIHAHTMQHVAVGRPRLLDEVRERLGLHAATAFSVSHLNCVAGLYALHLARCLLGPAPAGEKVLILTGDKSADHRGRLIPGITIQGDAAAACLVGADPRGDRVLGRALRVDGRFYQCVDCPPALLEEYIQLFVPFMSETVTEALASAGCDPADISLVFPQNSSRLAWKRISKNVGIPDGRIYLDNVSKTGHCCCSDPFINLKAARDSGRLKSGDLILLATTGMGAAFAATVVGIGEGKNL